VLEQHLQAARRTRELKFRFAISAAYPLILLVLAVSVVLAVLIGYVPQFEDIFQSFGVPLRLVTRWTRPHERLHP
jgi:type II secretory pathway component PulF